MKEFRRNTHEGCVHPADAFLWDQGKHIEDASVNAGAVKVKQKRRARQYMNRRGGFNRALPTERTGQTALRD